MIERYEYHHARLFGRCEQVGECLLWTGPVIHTGHGQVSYKGKMRLVHRFAWFLTFGVWPGQLNHRCGNPRCVNVGHVYEGDQRQNAHDSLLHGTARNQKLSAELVHEIQRRYAAGGVSQRALAAEFGISQPTVSNVVTGFTWGHLDETERRALA